MAEVKHSKNFVATGTTDACVFEAGPFNLSIWLTSDPTASIADTTVHLERSFDSGTTWLRVEKFEDTAVEKLIDNVEDDTQWRCNVTEYTAGITIRMGQ